MWAREPTSTSRLDRTARPIRREQEPTPRGSSPHREPRPRRAAAARPATTPTRRLVAAALTTPTRPPGSATTPPRRLTAAPTTPGSAALTTPPRPPPAPDSPPVTLVSVAGRTLDLDASPAAPAPPTADDHELLLALLRDTSAALLLEHRRSFCHLLVSTVLRRLSRCLRRWHLSIIAMSADDHAQLRRWLVSEADASRNRLKACHALVSAAASRRAALCRWGFLRLRGAASARAGALRLAAAGRRLHRRFLRHYLREWSRIAVAVGTLTHALRRLAAPLRRRALARPLRKWHAYAAAARAAALRLSPTTWWLKHATASDQHRSAATRGRRTLKARVALRRAEGLRRGLHRWRLAAAADRMVVLRKSVLKANSAPVRKLFARAARQQYVAAVRRWREAVGAALQQEEASATVLRIVKSRERQAARRAFAKLAGHRRRCAHLRRIRRRFATRGTLQEGWQRWRGVHASHLRGRPMWSALVGYARRRRHVAFRHLASVVAHHGTAFAAVRSVLRSRATRARRLAFRRWFVAARKRARYLSRAGYRLAMVVDDCTRRVWLARALAVLDAKARSSRGLERLVAVFQVRAMFKHWAAMLARPTKPKTSPFRTMSAQHAALSLVTPNPARRSPGRRSSKSHSPRRSRPVPAVTPPRGPRSRADSGDGSLGPPRVRRHGIYGHEGAAAAAAAEIADASDVFLTPTEK